MAAWQRQIKACEACGVSIIFLQARTGKWIPVNADTVADGDRQFEPGRHTAHWATCPDAARFRKREGEGTQ